jgi:hydrogenase expression/formation protein HypC
MCLAVPAEVLSIQGEMAACRVGRGQTIIKAALMLLPEAPQPGDYLIIHAGFALRVLDRVQAEESLRVLARTANCSVPTGTEG